MHQLFWILWLHLWSTLGRRGYDIYRWTRPNRPPRIFPESLLHRNTESLSHDCDCGSVNLDVMPENERYLFKNMVSTTMIRQNKCNDILGLTIKSNQIKSSIHKMNWHLKIRNIPNVFIRLRKDTINLSQQLFHQFPLFPFQMRKIPFRLRLT